jgi:hypothetical protein
LRSQCRPIRTLVDALAANSSGRLITALTSDIRRSVSGHDPHFLALCDVHASISRLYLLRDEGLAIDLEAAEVAAALQPESPEESIQIKNTSEYAKVETTTVEWLPHEA